MDTIKKNSSLVKYLVAVIFVVISAWWVALQVIDPSSDFPRYVWAGSYGVMALVGGVYGLFSAKRWGSFKSSLGKAIIYLAIGLLLAEFGQLIFSYYNVFKKVSVPYPSVADIGFFGNMFFYTLGGFALMKVLGVKIFFKKGKLKLIIGVVLPLVLLAMTFMLFLKGYDFTDVPKLQVFLDLGYPIGDAIYVSTALVSLLLVSGVIGGLLRKPLILLLLAFVIQYAADFNFLYQNHHLTWTNGGYGDYLYFVAYSMMTVALITLSNSFQKLHAAPVRSEVGVM